MTDDQPTMYLMRFVIQVPGEDGQRIIDTHSTSREAGERSVFTQHPGSFIVGYSNLGEVTADIPDQENDEADESEDEDDE